MSAKSKSSVRTKDNKNNKKNPRRVFDSKVLARARKLAGEYQVVMHSEEGRWYGRGLELPLVFGDGSSPEACIKDTREALVLAAATMIESGENPPTPAISGQRTEQVNVRLSAEERMLLEAAAKRRGYVGMSDFIRAVAVEAAR